MTAISKIKVGGIASWFGSNRILEREPGRELKGCPWVGIPFAGSMCEAKHIDARTLQINDKHSHLINLARVIGDRQLGPQLYRRLRRVPFHPDSLAKAQSLCQDVESDVRGGALFQGFNETKIRPELQLEWAEAYFIVAWMSRHSTAGTDGEFTGGISTRWNAGGGDSAAHYWGAVQSLVAWRREVLWRANFSTLDFRDFLCKCKDEKTTGIYNDPPFPGPGDNYKFKFTLQDHRDLAGILTRYKHARIVCRFYDHPLIRELYPAPQWTWRILKGGRKQTNESAPEVLLINGPSFAGGAA